MLYVDSNVFIYPALYEAATDRYAKAAKQELREIASGRLNASTCWLTWDEVVWVVRKTVGPKEASHQGRALLDLPNLQFLDIDQRILSSAQDLLDSYELTPRDAIHAATAIVNGIEEILSDDVDFDVVKELRRVPLL